MDHMILGLLILRSCSIYELRERIQAGLNLMYSSSMGSIQAALKKLLNGGFITVQEDAEGKRVRKIYSVTPSGREEFSAWVSSPMDLAAARCPELGKLYFMGFSDPASRCSHMEAALDSLRETHAILSAIVQQGESMEAPDQYKEILHYQLASARFGRDLMQFQIRWYTQFLQEEQERISWRKNP